MLNPDIYVKEIKRRRFELLAKDKKRYRKVNLLSPNQSWLKIWFGRKLHARTEEQLRDFSFGGLNIEKTIPMRQNMKLKAVVFTVFIGLKIK